MAPSSGHLLVPKAIKAFRFAISKSAAFIRSKVSQTSNATAALEAIPVRIARHPLHPLAALRQARSQHRSFTTAARRLAFDAVRPTPARTSFPASAVRSSLGRSTHAPFSSPLRPNLTGGTLPRTAGGYTLGCRGSTRAFSHVPAAQAQVVQNVSAAVRAFCLQGFRPQYDGIDPLSGNKRFHAVSVVQDKTSRAVRLHKEASQSVRGCSLEFALAPTVTALSPTSNSELDGANVLSGLAGDFARARKHLMAVQKALARLAVLGSLPTDMPDASTIRVRFPGCDGKTVTALCDEVGVLQGIVHEDPTWATEGGDRDLPPGEMALLFPWAPSKAPSDAGDYFEWAGNRHIDLPSTDMPQNSDLEWQSMLSTPQSPGLSTESLYNYDAIDDIASFDTLRHSDVDENESLALEHHASEDTRTKSAAESAAGYEGVEGIYRFLAEIDAAERRR